MNEQFTFCLQRSGEIIIRRLLIEWHNNCIIECNRYSIKIFKGM